MKVIVHDRMCKLINGGQETEPAFQSLCRGLRAMLHQRPERMPVPMESSCCELVDRDKGFTTFVVYSLILFPSLVQLCASFFSFGWGGVPGSGFSKRHFCPQNSKSTVKKFMGLQKDGQLHASKVKSATIELFQGVSQTVWVNFDKLLCLSDFSSCAETIVGWTGCVRALSWQMHLCKLQVLQQRRPLM
eukprot:1866400-Amphidinium_carterae.1